MLRVAAVTMVWNEAHFLPIWLRHYGRQVGLENCHIIDHGSNDGSTSALDCGSVIRIPRTPLDEDKRCAFVSQICSGLLEFYDVVIHSDVDELLVADPDIATSLAIFASMCDRPVITAVGLNVVQSLDTEANIDPSRVISTQRDSIWFVAAMCKPMMIRRPVKWVAGFHNCNSEIRFEGIYNFHLRYYDLERGLTRLKKTREMERAFPGLNAHQAIPDEQWKNDFLYGINTRPILENITLKLAEDPLCRLIARIETEQYERRNTTYTVDLDLREPDRWKLPARFVGSF